MEEASRRGPLWGVLAQYTPAIYLNYVRRIIKKIYPYKRMQIAFSEKNAIVLDLARKCARENKITLTAYVLEAIREKNKEECRRIQRESVEKQKEFEKAEGGE